MKTIKTWEDFLNENVVLEALSELQTEYRAYFRFFLDCYGVNSPTKLSKEKKKEFFDNVKKYWVKGSGATKDLKKIKADLIEAGCCKDDE